MNFCIKSEDPNPEIEIVIPTRSMKDDTTREQRTWNETTAENEEKGMF